MTDAATKPSGLRLNFSLSSYLSAKIYPQGTPYSQSEAQIQIDLENNWQDDIQSPTLGGVVLRRDTTLDLSVFERTIFDPFAYKRIDAQWDSYSFSLVPDGSKYLFDATFHINVPYSSEYGGYKWGLALSAYTFAKGGEATVYEPSLGMPSGVKLESISNRDIAAPLQVYFDSGLLPMDVPGFTVLDVASGTQTQVDAGYATISGSLPVAKTGAGTLVLTTANTYPGTTTIAAGTLQIGSGTSGSVGGDIVNNSVLAFDRSNTLSYAGTISGTGSLAKWGAGNLELGGTSSYTGATTVGAGRLSVNGALGNSPVMVLAAAELGGSGSIGGPVSVESGGTLSPGNSIESLLAGTVTYAAGAAFAYEVDSSNPLALGTAADLLAVNGDLNLDTGNGSILTFTDLASSPNPFVNNTTIFALVNYTGTWNGGLFTHNGNVLGDGSTFTVGTQQWMIDYNSLVGGANFTGDYLPSSRFVTITAVPEPSTYAMALAGIACGGFSMWRRRRVGLTRTSQHESNARGAGRHHGPAPLCVFMARLNQPSPPA